MKRISDFPSDGIIYTTDKVMFHRDDIEKFLPPCKHPNFEREGGFDSVFQKYSKHPQLIDAIKFVEMIRAWWGSDLWELASSINGSAIAYKPAEEPAAYLFETTGLSDKFDKPTNEYYVVGCKDAMTYKNLVKNYRRIITERPIEISIDNPEITIAGMELRLRERGMSLVSRGPNIWMVYDATRPANMRTLVKAAFNLKPI